MRRTLFQIKTGVRGFAPILIACLLALRVAALPMVIADGAPGPGMMAICTGTEIIYIPIGSQSLPEKGTSGEGKAQHDPCPAFGITAVLIAADLSVAAPTRVATTTPVMPHASVWASAEQTGPYQPRAPPRLWS